MANFVDELAPGSSNTWRDICQSAEPGVDGSGFLIGPWGDAIRAAVACEQQDPNWEQRFPDGPAGNVISLLMEQGHEPFEEAASRTEEACKSGSIPMGVAPAIMQAQVVGAPMQMDMGGMSPALACLAAHPRIEVKEKASWIEAITAAIGFEIEMANKYKIYAEGGENELFYAVEQTDCCARQCKSSCPDCAPWNVHILHHDGMGGYGKAFHMERPQTCTCCCLNRPIVDIHDSMAGEKKIGSIQDPFACCDLTFTLRDPNDEPVLKALGGCCQLGLICPLPCGPCSKVNFEVVDAKTNESVGSIQKRVPSCCKFLFASDVDNYYVEFGKVQDPTWKAMMMALSIFIDFRYFSDNKNDDGGFG